jgi:hypothetical protein
VGVPPEDGPQHLRALAGAFDPVRSGSCVSSETVEDEANTLHGFAARELFGYPLAKCSTNGALMNRICAITVATLAVAAAPPLARAEDRPKLPRIGFLNPLDRAAPHFEAFKQGLAEGGYVDGRNVVIEARFAEGQYDRFPTLIAELVAAKVDIIAVTGAVTARAAKKAATGIPIVFAVVVDPVADGVVSELERPGGSITGTTSFDPLQARKQLELLKEAIPGLNRVALLGDQGVSEARIRCTNPVWRTAGEGRRMAAWDRTARLS